MDGYHRLTDEQITEAKYLFKAIDMAKSDEEIDFDFCTSSSSPTAEDFVEFPAHQHDPKMFPWNFVKHRRRPHRRYTVSHGGGSGCSSLPPAPPAPPSTPTSLTASNTPMSSPTDSANIAGGNSGLAAQDDTINSLLYLLDYAPKYKKKLKEQQRTDTELAELFNVVTITSSGVGGGGGGGASVLSSSYLDAKLNKLPAERGISCASRVIRKHDAGTKIFKIHRNPKEFFRDLDEENSVSAPEYDTEEEDTRYRRYARLKPSRRFYQSKRQRRFARFEHKERMEDMVDTFDASMSFNDA